MHFSLPFPNPSIYPYPLPLRFMASFLTNYYCMHICMHLYIPKYNLLCTSLVCMFSGLTTGTEQPTGMLFCSQVSSIDIALCAALMPWGFLSVHLVMATGINLVQLTFVGETLKSFLFNFLKFHFLFQPQFSLQPLLLPLCLPLTYPHPFFPKYKGSHSKSTKARTLS